MPHYITARLEFSQFCQNRLHNCTAGIFSILSEPARSAIISAAEIEIQVVLNLSWSYLTCLRHRLSHLNITLNYLDE